MDTIDGHPILQSGTIMLRSGETGEVQGPAVMKFSESGQAGQTQIVIVPTPAGMDFHLVGFAPGAHYIQRFQGSLPSGQAYDGLLSVNRVAEIAGRAVFVITYQIRAN